MVGETISHYRVVQALGSGGMGDVYLAEDTRLSRRVALKVAKRVDGNLMRWSREAKTAAVLSHPNIAQIFDAGIDSDVAWIAMELIDGVTLDDRIATGNLAILEIVDIAAQIADALDEAHQNGIVHRDVKPSNVMLTRRRMVKVLDFGLAKVDSLLRPLDHTATQTNPGAVLGTIHYLSPEQALGHRVDERSDIFSFGVVMYQMVTRRLPFPGANSAEVLQKIAVAQPEAMARFNYELPQELERIIRKCLEKEPDRRYQSAREIHVDLRNLLRDLGQASPLQPVSRRRHHLTLSVAAAAAVAFAIAGGAWMMKKPAPPVAGPTIKRFSLVTPPALGATEPVMDNGCSVPSLDTMNWRFRWKMVPAAAGYQLRVTGARATVPLIDIGTTGTDYEHEGNGYISESNRRGWRWRVRAQVNGEWQDWSEEKTFDVEPVNTDCPR
jgi:predicted Ser/Thr protein kinase